MKKSIITFVVLVLAITINAQDTAIYNFKKAPKKFKKGIDKTLTQYFDVKNGFVEEDQKKIIEGANGIKVELNALVKEKLTPEQITYFDAHKTQILNVCEILKQDSISVEAKRRSFETLSHSMYALIKSFRANRITVYKQYCPMAFNNTGAYWLSTRELILNPYFANKMLNCGDVVEVIE